MDPVVAAASGSSDDGQQNNQEKMDAKGSGGHVRHSSLFGGIFQTVRRASTVGKEQSSTLQGIGQSAAGEPCDCRKSARSGMLPVRLFPPDGFLKDVTVGRPARNVQLLPILSDASAALRMHLASCKGTASKAECADPAYRAGYSSMISCSFAADMLLTLPSNFFVRF